MIRRAVSTVGTGTSRLSDLSDVTATGARAGWPLAVAAASGGVASTFGIAQAVDDIACWGDSLTESVGTNWPSLLATNLGVSVYNGGVSGQATTDAAIRQGGVTPLLTVSGNQIPASGAVTVTTLSPTTSYRADGSGAFSFAGTLAGVAGTLTHNMDADTWSFTRTSAGSAVSCPAGTPFYGTAGDSYRSRIAVLWPSGRNNQGDSGGTLDDIVRDADLMSRAVSPVERRVLVLGPTTTSGQTSGSAGYLAVAALVTAMATRYGTRFLDVWAWVMSDGLAQAGITPTSQDVTDLAGGVIPTSLRADGTHLNATGYGLVAKLVANKIRALGWRTGQLPAATPGQVTGVTAGAPTGSTVPLSWTAVSGADAYRVEYRATGASTWLPGGYTTGTGSTISGLTSGTGYDFRVTARTISGYGTPSATVTATTTGTAPTVVASDSFDRADSTSLGSTDNAGGGTTKAWTTTGQIGIVSNTAGRTGTTSARFATVDASVTDARVQAKLAVMSDTTDCNLVGRWADSSNFYRLVVSTAGNVNISKTVAGTTSVIGSTVNGAAHAGDTIALSVIGSTLKAYVNGVEIISQTDTALATGTSWGFGLPSSLTPRWDDFVVYDH